MSMSSIDAILSARANQQNTNRSRQLYSVRGNALFLTYLGYPTINRNSGYRPSTRFAREPFRMKDDGKSRAYFGVYPFMPYHYVNVFSMMLKSILPRVGQNGVPMGMTLFFPASSSKHFSSYFKSFCIRVASFLETQIDETPIPFFAVFS